MDGHGLEREERGERREGEGPGLALQVQFGSVAHRVALDCILVSNAYQDVYFVPLNPVGPRLHLSLVYLSLPILVVVLCLIITSKTKCEWIASDHCLPYCAPSYPLFDVFCSENAFRVSVLPLFLYLLVLVHVLVPLLILIIPRTCSFTMQCYFSHVTTYVQCFF